MLQAMFSGVSGLDVHQTALDVIGNNIANVNTLGFKSGTVNFEDQLSQTLTDASAPNSTTGGQNPGQVGLGVLIGSIDNNQTQGNIQTTGKNTDLAIQGNGFFMVGAGTNISYTRDGSFNIDSAGELVNPANGAKLLGYQANSSGKIDTTQPVQTTDVIKIPVGQLASVKETTQTTLTGNLDGSSSLQSTIDTLAGSLDPSLTPPDINSTVYDALGGTHSLNIHFSNPVASPPAGPGVPTGATQQWTLAVSLDGVVTNQTLYGVGSKFVFTNGSSPGSVIGSTMQLNGVGTSGAANFPLGVDFSQISDISAIQSSADGQSAPTKVASTTISLTGNVSITTPPSPADSTIYDQAGNAYTIQTSFSNATDINPPSTGGSGVPVGATASFDVKVTNQTNATTLYDSSVAANNQSKAYYVPGQGYVLANPVNGNVLSSTISLSTLPGTTGFNNIGTEPVSGLPITIQLGSLTSSKLSAIPDGKSGTPPTWSTSTQVYDNLGVSHLITFRFNRALVGAGGPTNAAARWEWSASENGNTLSSSSQGLNKPLFFDGAGNLIDTGSQSFNVKPTSGAPAFTVNMNFSQLTQLSGSSTINSSSQDGYPVGVLQSFSVGQDGTITGVFSNGQSRSLAQVALANFQNAGGLKKIGDNLFTTSTNSGAAQVGVPSTNGTGTVDAGYVEMSNVDLSTEFTNLIVTERGFQANTKIITTVDSLLQDVLSMKQSP